jgi:hypothetical protein
MDSMGTTPEREVYVVSTTLGLAMQACSFVEVKDKIERLRAVIDGLAKTKEVMLQSDEHVKRIRTLGFLFYYLYGRNSVASSILRDCVEEVMDKWKVTTLSKDDINIRMSWLLIGLIESGSCHKSEELLEKFRPVDGRLLRGIHLGCFLAQHM